MGADTKALKSRIRSVDSTLHTTRAMGLVASSKMRRANEVMQNSRQYSASFSKAVEMLTVSPECAQSPYLTGNDADRTKLIVIAGDRGLAGGYNANIFRMVATLGDVDIVPVGKRACDRYGKGYMSSETFSRMDASELSKKLCAEFLNGEFDKLGILYTRYVSMMTQEPVLVYVLPLERAEGNETSSVLFEPNEQEVLDSVVPNYVAGRIMHAVRESFASEVAARRMAMDSAGKNAQAMIDDLQLQYNRARQNAITQEITEIVAGSGNY